MGALLLLIACVGGMGSPCASSDECRGGGTCLAGACSGYDCHSDDDCNNGHSCLDVAGVKACAVPCEADEDCPGQQSCREPSGDTGAAVCL
jgi:hypothetical protein